jgi:hypothetical protein
MPDKGCDHIAGFAERTDQQRLPAERGHHPGDPHALTARVQMDLGIILAPQVLDRHRQQRSRFEDEHHAGPRR